MSRLLLLFVVVLLPAFLKAQVQIVRYNGYTSYWNAITLIPDSVVYTVVPHKKLAKRLRVFHVTGGRLNENPDYKASGYDHGHLCDAKDEDGNTGDEYNSFDQCNIYPQRKHCNRRTWYALEKYIRKLSAQYGAIRVKVYWHGIAGYMGPDKVTIPLYCDKEIWYNGAHEKYSMPNQDTVSTHKFTWYKVN